MNSQLLEKRMAEQGISVKAMYTALGISRSAFYRKCKGLSDFTLSEARQIMELLSIEDANDIFLRRKYPKGHTQEL